ALDFDDLLFCVVEIFRRHPDRLRVYQKKFRYIMVDEYQDTNHAQYTLVTLLARIHRNICVVGDDWQSIYGWRGADFRNILNFTKDYPDAETVYLEQNYRSTKTILEAAHAVIEKNAQRTDKRLWTNKEQGSFISCTVVGSGEAEAHSIVETIREKVEITHVPAWNQFAVLYRMNAQSRTLEEAFLHAGIPYRIVGNVRFYERREVKDILAYLRLLAHPEDVASFFRIANVPRRGIGTETLKKFRNGILPSTGAPRIRIDQFVRQLDELRPHTAAAPLSHFLKSLLEKIRYEAYLEHEFGREESEERWENVLELLSVAKKYDVDSERLSAIEKFLEEIALMSDQDEIAESKNRVHLMTLHAAKGLEFPIVFLTGLEEGVFPHSRSTLHPEDIEEERRLCYVGLTRAQEELHLSFARTRLLHGTVAVNPPSRFLADIPAHLLTISEYDALPTISVEETG
ncbi:MAG: UvrD-helicase domain-containing protein, partial [Parcubacteria group bacterium]|nr:UvrD-helicase domain-containing protein [Parcubacteria group bacterium]